MIEHEKKLLLSKKQYEYLFNNYCTTCSDITVIKQVNYYFDTDDFIMNRRNITCRIRLKNGKYVGTMKQHSSGTDNSTETQVNVKNGILENDFTEAGLKLQGELVTKRYILHRDSSSEVVLDKNEYLGYEDYELEIEYSDGHEKEACDIYDKILTEISQIHPYPKDNVTFLYVPSKSTRFFKRKSILTKAH